MKNEKGDRDYRLSLAAQEPGNIPVFEVVVEAAKGDEAAKHILREIAKVIGMKLAQLIDMLDPHVVVIDGDTLPGLEKELFLRALKTLAWQESRWQHYLRYQDWFFVIVSGGSYNKLDDWGITQVARSSFDPEKLLNNNFFASKGYCSIASSLYYGFMEYYFCYLEAREHPGNGPSLFDKIVGAYNRYSSGFSACYYELATNDAAYRDYQIRAMGGFKDNFVLMPWAAVMQEAGHD